VTLVTILIINVGIELRGEKKGSFSGPMRRPNTGLFRHFLHTWLSVRISDCCFRSDVTLVTEHPSNHSVHSTGRPTSNR
jgi:hypothetical protein